MWEYLAQAYGIFWLVVVFVLLPIGIIYFAIRRVKDKKKEHFEKREN